METFTSSGSDRETKIDLIDTYNVFGPAMCEKKACRFRFTGIGRIKIQYLPRIYRRRCFARVPLMLSFLPTKQLFILAEKAGFGARRHEV